MNGTNGTIIKTEDLKKLAEAYEITYEKYQILLGRHLRLYRIIRAYLTFCFMCIGLVFGSSLALLVGPENMSTGGKLSTWIIAIFSTAVFTSSFYIQHRIAKGE